MTQPELDANKVQRI